MIDAKRVAELREMTGAGMMDAKKALEVSLGDLEKAAEELRKRGLVKAASKAERETKEGRVYAYIHATGKVGAMVEIQCETDFVARNEKFVDLCHGLAMHVVAMNPSYLDRTNIPSEVEQKEKEIYQEEASASGKPAQVVEKIVQGKFDKFCEDHCLLEQFFIKDETKTIESLLKEYIVILGENIAVKRFSRFEIG